MGSYISCASSAVTFNVVKVVLFYGRVQEFDRPIKAAELMLENPQHFVCHSNGLQTGRRIAALSADDDLETGQIYFVLPMQKLHSVLSPSDMASLAFKSNSALKKASSGSNKLTKILPVFGDLWQLPVDRKAGIANGEEADKLEERETADIVVPKLQVDDLPEQSLAFCKHRLSCSRRNWKPVLETINEAAVRSRQSR